MNLETEILKVTKNKISENDITSWLEYNFSNFIICEKTKKCSERTLPCFCFERNKECLFRVC